MFSLWNEGRMRAWTDGRTNGLIYTNYTGGWTIWKPADIHTHVLSIVKLRMMIVCSATEHRERNSKSFIKSFLQKLKRNQPQSLAIITSQKPLW